MKSTTILGDLLRLSLSKPKYYRRQAMRFLLVLIAVAAAIAFARCDSPSEDDSSTETSSTDEMETDVDGLYESARSPLDKAANVEDVLQDSADKRDAAIDEATNGT
jgi:hypothetical protein